MDVLFLFFNIAVVGHTVNSARILGIFHMGTISHHLLGDKILKKLAARGHQVTVITPFEEKSPPKNFRQILLTGVVEMTEEQKSKHLFEQPSKNVFMKAIILDIIGLHFTEHVLNHTNVQKLLRSNEQFELIILEHFFNQAFQGFCYHFKAPCILSSTVGANRWTNPVMGNSGPSSYVPDVLQQLSSSMTFWERLCNTFIYVTAELFSHLYTLPKQNEILQKYFPNAPHLFDMYYNTSLMLINSHVSTNPPTPLVPGMIEVGGFHIHLPKPLPSELRDYLDSAKDGAILFNMGSSLKSTNLPLEKRNALFAAFSKQKQKVLMRWDDQTLLKGLLNVKLCKWLPQQDVLAHPNVNLFVHHGGLLSIREAIYHGKPSIGIPIFGDHGMNVAYTEAAGYGIGVSFTNLTEESLGHALHMMLSDSKYTTNAQKASKIMHDQSMQSLDKAIFWIEYILRHKGAPHLRTDSLNLWWYQYLLLDVLIFITLFIVVVLFIFYRIASMLWHTTF